ncbi:MAG: hypothetical protein JWR26_3422 [Pedosphaera sp.]|nr:hypothetical protein [Pedosphaera sp.]
MTRMYRIYRMKSVVACRVGGWVAGSVASGVQRPSIQPCRRHSGKATGTQALKCRAIVGSSLRDFRTGLCTRAFADCHGPPSLAESYGGRFGEENRVSAKRRVLPGRITGWKGPKRYANHSPLIGSHRLLSDSIGFFTCVFLLEHLHGRQGRLRMGKFNHRDRIDHIETGMKTRLLLSEGSLYGEIEAVVGLCVGRGWVAALGDERAPLQRCLRTCLGRRPPFGTGSPLCEVGVGFFLGVGRGCIAAPETGALYCKGVLTDCHDLGRGVETTRNHPQSLAITRGIIIFLCLQTGVCTGPLCG